MRYVLKEKLFDWGDDYAIRDESGREVYRVDGKVLAIGDKLVLEDRDGNTVATIRKKLISLRSAYEIHRDGHHAATVTKALFSPLRCKFSVDLPGPADMEARGDILDHEYELTRDGQRVAEVSKRWISIRDTYAIDVAEGEDDVLVLACAVVLERMCHDEDEGTHES
jgi:uncharacterized protein YxjI